MKTEWSDDIVLLLIQEIENLPVLWNSNDPCFKIIRKKNEAWEMLSLQFNRTAEDVKKKWQSLLASYRRERGREKNGSSGLKSSKRTKSHWFAYKAMSFFGGRYKPRSTLKSETSNADNSEDDTMNDDEDEWEDEADEIKNENTDVTIMLANDPLAKSSYSDPRKLKRPAVMSSNPVPVKIIAEDSRVNEYCEIQRNPVPRNDNERDEFMIYGEYVASKLRKLDSRSSTVTQHYINKILFEAELGRYKESFLDKGE